MLLRRLTLLLPFASVACGQPSRMPEPGLAGQVAPLPPAEAAVIALPVTIATSAVRQQLDAALPVADSLDRARCTAIGGMVCHQYVYRREPLLVSMRGDRFTVDARLRYRGRVALPGVGGLGSCGYAPEPMRRAELHLATSLYWRSDWRLGSRDTQLAAELLDPCRVTVVRADATPLMRRIADAQLRGLRHEVDSIIPRLLDLRPVADSLWRAFQQPMALDSASTTWLQMNVGQVGLAPVAAAEGSIRTALVLTAYPRVQVGAAPAPGARQLPPLSVAPPSAGLRIPVDVTMPFAEIGPIATAALNEQAAGRGLQVRDVKVWGAGDTAVVRVDVAGKANGTFYLVGRVSWDGAARVVRIDGLQYTVASHDLMTKLKVTLGAPLIRRALEQATSHGRLNVGAQLDSVRYQLSQQLNGPLAPGISVGGGIRDVRVVGLFATSRGFVVRVVLEGAAQLFVQ